LSSVSQSNMTVPIGTIMPFSDGTSGLIHVIRGTHGWYECNGSSFSADEDLELALLFEFSRPKDANITWWWRFWFPGRVNRLKSEAQARQSEWDRGYRYTYGGNSSAVNLPDLRTSLISTPCPGKALANV